MLMIYLSRAELEIDVVERRKAIEVEVKEVKSKNAKQPIFFIVVLTPLLAHYHDKGKGSNKS